MTSYQRLRLLLTSALDPNQKLVAIALSDHMSDTRGYALCGVARLALLTSLSERTVQRVLNQGDGVWLKRDIKPGAKQYPTYILWSKLPKQEETGDNGSPVQDSHPCQTGTGDEEAQVTGGPATGDSLSEEGCQPVRLGVTGCHPKPTIKPTSEANERSQPGPPPPQPEAEPDWEAIAAATIKARDAEIDGYFTSPIEPPPPPKPEPTTRKPTPDFGALFGGGAAVKPQQPQAEPEEVGLPVDLDLLQMLTTRPDGAQATALGVATRWVRLLTSQGIDSPGDLQRYTVREIQMLPGMSAPSAGHVQAALEAWGGELAKGGRELVDDLRRRVLRNDSSLTAAERRQMEAANLRTSDIKKMSDYDVNTYAQRLDAARSRM